MRTDPRYRGNDSPITRLRLAKGWTQTRLAEEVGCLRGDISRWERGERRPNTGSALKLARALGCKIEDLFAI
jgi:transcriptional regulator with XRE-family HTH domain